MNKKDVKKNRTKASDINRRARYRLDIVNENSFTCERSYKFSRSNVGVAVIVALFFFSVLFWCLFAYTPVRTLLPGALSGDLRAQYLEAAFRLDSLEIETQRRADYAANIRAILRGEATHNDTITSTTPQPIDSLLAASDAERQFVRSYEQEERFNLSVLAPIAAEGMIFTSPLTASAECHPLPSGGVAFTINRAVPVSAIYRGTVVAMIIDNDGCTTIVVQHPNDFVSTFSGLSNVYVNVGTRVAAGQRIADTTAKVPMNFDLWHNGTALDPREYIAF